MVLFGMVSDLLLAGEVLVIFWQRYLVQKCWKKKHKLLSLPLKGIGNGITDEVANVDFRVLIPLGSNTPGPTIHDGAKGQIDPVVVARYIFISGLICSSMRLVWKLQEMTSYVM